MLPLFGMLLFALLGIGALIVDGGLALSEQARLDTAAEMLAHEWRHVRALPDSELPAQCRDSARGSDARERCLRETRLGPLLEPLGLVLEPATGPEQRALSLDGTPLESRGVRLGPLDAQGVLDGTAGTSFRLSRSTPLLLGWGALLPGSPDTGDPDFLEVQEARRREGMAPTLSGRGLRTGGFALEGRAGLNLAGALALRVGPRLPARPDVAGAVGIALQLTALEQLATAIFEGAGSATLDVSGPQLGSETVVRAGGDVAGCSFDPGTSGRGVGDLPARTPGLAFDPAQPIPVAYLAIVEACDRPVLGFVQLAIGPGPAPGEITLSRTTPGAARPNAAGTPGTPAAASRAAAVLAQGPDGPRAALTDPGARWAPIVVRTPRLVPTPEAVEER